ncbi:MAG TPA: hypothetical protein P5069_18075, partial [Candidatus Hydrogenedentes bacterium]|nr:hypothetical protein [Candidatus Hydrogenedentota bacterium]
MGRSGWKSAFPVLAVCVCVLAHGAGRLERKPLGELLALHKDKDARVDREKLEGVLRERLSKEDTGSLLKIRRESAAGFMCVDYFYPTILEAVQEKDAEQTAAAEAPVVVQAVVRQLVYDREVLVGDILRRELSPLPTTATLEIVRSDPAGLPSEVEGIADLEWEYVGALEEGREYFLVLLRNGNRHTFHHTRSYAVQEGRVPRALGRVSASVQEVWQAVEMRRKADRGEPFEMPQEWNAALNEGSLEQVMGALETAQGVGVFGQFDAPLLLAALERHYPALREALDQCSGEYAKRQELEAFGRVAGLVFWALAEIRNAAELEAAFALYVRDGEHFTPAFQNCDKVIALAVAALPVEVRAERLKTLFGPPHKVQNADPNCRNEGERTLVDTARAVQALERVPGPDIDAFLLDMSRNPNA